MTIRSKFSSLTITVFIGTCLIACGQNSKRNQHDKAQVATVNKLDFDTSKTAIIPFDQKGNYPFDNAYKPSTFTPAEIQTVDSLLIQCLTDYNKSLEKAYKHLSIDLSSRDYKKQIIVVTNKKGDKEVWVNFFCSTWDKDWHKDILLVHDGGNCYFNFKINLTTFKYYDLMVNGEA